MIGTLTKQVRAFLAKEDGPTAVEYAVMLALIIVVCIVAITALGTNANKTFTNNADPEELEVELTGFVKAGGWSGMVDLESGVPLSAGIPQGDEQFVGERANDVIPYLSHGILAQAQADDVAQAGDDPYLTDIHVRPGESLGGPDGGPVVTRPQATRAQEPKPDAKHTERVWTDRD